MIASENLSSGTHVVGEIVTVLLLQIIETRDVMDELKVPKLGKRGKDITSGLFMKRRHSYFSDV